MLPIFTASRLSSRKYTAWRLNFSYFPSHSFTIILYLHSWFPGLRNRCVYLFVVFSRSSLFWKEGKKTEEKNFITSNISTLPFRKPNFGFLPKHKTKSWNIEYCMGSVNFQLIKWKSDCYLERRTRILASIKDLRKSLFCFEKII